MTLENGETVYAEFAASSVKRFVLLAAQMVGKGIEVASSPSGTSLTHPDGRVISARRNCSLFFLPAELVASLEEDETFRRAMELFGPDEEERIPERGDRVRPEGLLRTPEPETEDRQR